MLARALRQVLKTPGIAKSLPLFSAHFFSTKIENALPVFKKNTNSLTPSPERWQLIYDGGCSACTATAHHLKMDDMDLINAREGKHPTIMTLEAAGYNFDKHMGLVSTNGTVYTGVEALREIAKRRGGFYKATLGSTMMLTFYPGLVAVRNFLVSESIAAGRGREAKKAQSEPIKNNYPDNSGMK